MADPAKAVAEMTRTVRPGGWVAPCVWDEEFGGSPTQPLQTAIVLAFWSATSGAGRPKGALTRAAMKLRWPDQGWPVTSQISPKRCSMATGRGLAACVVALLVGRLLILLDVVIDQASY